MFTPQNFVGYWPASSEVPLRRGVEGVRLGVQRIRTAFPDWNEQVLDVFGAEERVASRYVSTGTHSGQYWGLEPTGKRIEIQEISIFRCAYGLIVEQWCLFDELARLQQLGAREAYLRKVLKL
jgi:predicted ester cyclase